MPLNRPDLDKLDLNSELDVPLFSNCIRECRDEIPNVSTNRLSDVEFVPSTERMQNSYHRAILPGVRIKLPKRISVFRPQRSNKILPARRKSCNYTALTCH